MSVSADPHLFWITSRAAEITAMVLASATVGYGLTMAGRLRRGSNTDRRVLHEVLSLGVMVSLSVHGLTLIGDRFLQPSLGDVLLPFAMAYQRWWSTLGIVAGWALVALGLSYYVRRRIGIRRWQVIHRFTLLAWVGGLAHSFGEGTDAGRLWFIALIGLTAAPAVVLVVLRASGRRLPARQPSPPVPASAPTPTSIIRSL